jgi:glycosyltransferase involved in cell wall biosynthesis
VNHIALMIPGLDRIGGAERQVTLLAKGLHNRRWRVSVVALSGTGGVAAAELVDAGVAFLSLHMRKGLADPRGWVRFHRWLTEQVPDIVHAHLSHAAWLARWSRLVSPSRVVIDTLHSSSTGSLGRQLGYRISDGLTDQITAVSQAAANAHLDANMAANISVLPNGIDVSLWQPEAHMRQSLRHDLLLEDEFLWFAAGRLEPVKDYPTLLAAMAQLPKSAQLVIAGGGPLESELRQLTSELGIELRVRFLGFEPDVKRWMQAADGFVLSSRWEGLPMALLEAAACALPAVATDVPGTREAIVDGQTGLLTTPGDPNALAATMLRMMQGTPDHRRAMGDRAHQRIVDCFSLENVLNRWEALYADLLQRNRRPTRWAQ